MPELPDITVYVERLQARLLGDTLEGIRLRSPFLLRTVAPPLPGFDGLSVTSVERIGKRIVFGFDEELFLVVHLMIAGRLRWRDPGAKLGGKATMAAFDFARGSLLLTEAGAKKRASLHAVQGRQALAVHDPGGHDVLSGDLDGFRAALARENRTLKRALTSPRLIDGIGNAYSDEILHHARLSPFKLTGKLTEDEVTRLHDSARQVLEHWADTLRSEVGEGFPEKVTAFRPGMAVHGRTKEPCPDCGSPVQRIYYAGKNELNYCARCQTDGKILADRVLSRLLKQDFPRRLED